MRRAVGPRGKPNAVRRAREQRRTMTLPEIALWTLLRQRPCGLKFRRNHPFGGELALDFHCGDARPAVEVEGEAHSRGDRPGRDAAPDAVLRARGVETLRLPAVEVLRDMDAVMRGVLAACVARLPLHHPAARGGPPRRDEPGKDRGAGYFPHIRNTPNLGVSAMGALRQAASARPRTSRVWAGSMTPSSHRRAVAW